MSFVIPIPDPTDPEGPPIGDVAFEMQMQRDLTHWFIMQDPTEIVLLPVAQAETPAGGRRAVFGAPRPTQTFKLIQMNHTERPEISQSGEDGGVQRKHDFTLLGEWNATVGINDQWTDALTGQVWKVDSIVPYNGYEVKAMVMSYGDRADHG